MAILEIAMETSITKKLNGIDIKSFDEKSLTLGLTVSSEDQDLDCINITVAINESLAADWAMACSQLDGHPNKLVSLSVDNCAGHVTFDDSYDHIDRVHAVVNSKKEIYIEGEVDGNPWRSDYPIPVGILEMSFGLIEASSYARRQTSNIIRSILQNNFDDDCDQQLSFDQMEELISMENISDRYYYLTENLLGLDPYLVEKSLCGRIVKTNKEGLNPKDLFKIVWISIDKNIDRWDVQLKSLKDGNHYNVNVREIVKPSPVCLLG